MRKKKLYWRCTYLLNLNTVYFGVIYTYLFNHRYCHNNNMDWLFEFTEHDATMRYEETNAKNYIHY